jgi:glycine cleavage system transcriptional repressor
MKKWIAVSALGQDRPGIVAALTHVLYEKGCNLENSSMTRLKGDFAILLLVSMSKPITTSELDKALQAVAKPQGLLLTLRELSAQEADPGADSTTLPYTLMVYGMDKPGIVYRIAQAAAHLHINITDLRTHVTEGTAGPLYSLVMEIEIPGQGIVKAFEDKLQELRTELRVETTLTLVTTDEL